MQRLKIGVRLNLVSMVALAGLALVLVLSLVRLSSVMHADISDRTRKTVETAFSVVEQYHKLEASGAMTREAAQQAALASLKAMRYGNNDYFWVNDMQPRMIMHPIKPEMDGTEIGGITDADGVRMFQKMADLVREKGEGFVDYRWPKPGVADAQPKVSFVKGFAPWGWVVGSGVYADDVRDAIWNAALGQGLLVLAVILVVVTLNFLISRSISRPVLALTERMRGLAAGDTRAEIPGLGRGDEVGEMATALGVFRDGLIAKNAAEAAKAKADAEQNFVVETISERLAKVADGDLTAEVTVDFPSAYAALKRHYNDAIRNLRELIGALAGSVENIRNGSSEIAQASDDLARRTEGNAASLEETSAALTQMEARLRTTATAATNTVARTGEAKAVVGAGRATADEAVGAMGRVSESAEGIDSVIEGLDKIAFQTRVLAMNAAVEAGRAGEAGRGFAVVADLVSALAMRSEEEAKRAREQLTATQADIGIAVGAVQRVDSALADITGSVDEVHQLVTTMAQDNQAQSATISEITVAVGTMDQSTQQNAAMVEQTSAAARNLASEVESLAGRAAQFKTGKESVGAAIVRPAPQPRAPARAVVRPILPTPVPAAGGADDWATF